MECPHCHHNNPAGEETCLYCGSILPKASDTEEIPMPTPKKWDAFQKKNIETEKIVMQPKVLQEDIQPIKEKNKSNNKLLIIGCICGICVILLIALGLRFVMPKRQVAIGSIVKDSELPTSLPSTTPTETSTPSAKADTSSTYILTKSNTKELMESDLTGLSAKELTYARNEIYARHGMVFKSNELNEYFNKQDWYQANDNYDGSLSDVEIKNAEFILNYQNDNNLQYNPQ